jgi:peptidoglycan hydrolase-like protein with peptidoglycan-binding domain
MNRFMLFAASALLLLSPASTVFAAAPNLAQSHAHKMSQKRVEEIQAGLNQHGLTVDVDGIWGPKTAQALTQFQRTNKLPATGHLTRATLKKLDPPTWKGV